MKKYFKKILFCLFTLTMVFTMFCLLHTKEKVSANNATADLMDFKYSFDTEGKVEDVSPFKWSILKTADPQIEKVTVSHLGNVYKTVGFRKDFLNDGLTINWKAKFDSDVKNKMSDGFSMTIAFSIDEFIVSNQSRILMGNAASGGVNIQLDSSNKIVMQMHDTTGYVNLASKNAIVTNEMYYVTVVYDATQLKTFLYINGVLDNEANVKGFRASTKYGMSVGGVCDGADPKGIATSAYRADNGKYICNQIYSDTLSATTIKAKYDEFIASLDVEVKEADIANFNLGETVTDASGMNAPVHLSGTYQLGETQFGLGQKTYKMTGYHKNHINQGVTFNWASEEIYTDAFVAKFQDGFSISTAFVLSELLSGERVLFGNAASGGVSLGINGSKIFVEMHNGSGYTVTKSTEDVKVGYLYHVTGVFDKVNELQKLYINGELVGQSSMSAYRLGTKKGISLGGVCDGADPQGIALTAYRADLGYYFEGKIYGDILSEQDIVTNFRALMKNATEIESPKVTEVINLINAIGEVTVDSASKITLARQAYDALNDYEKSIVTNYNVLLEAEFMIKIFNQVPVNFDEENITTKIGIVSDMHIGYPGADTKYTNALDKLIKYTGGLDAVLNCGDMTQNGTAEEVQLLKTLTEAKIDIDTIPYIFNYGNHDTYWSGCMDTAGFKAAFGDSYFKFDVDQDSIASGNRHVVVNGVHFVSVQTQTYMPGNNVFSQATLNWLESTLKSITTQNPNAYVVVSGHSPVTDTIFGSAHDTTIGNWGSNTQLGEIFKKYPQVVYFSGHTHYSIFDERAIHQGDFTSVLVGSSSDLELIPDTVEGVALANRRDYSTGMVLEFDANGNMRITRYDFAKDEQIKQSWVLPAPEASLGHLTYYTNYRGTYNNNAPVFTEGELNLNIVNNSTISVTYPKATDDDMVFTYKINVYNGENQLLKSVTTINNFFDYPNVANMPATRTTNVSGVTIKKPYTVEVIAIDSWGNQSEAIALTILDTTEEDMAKAKIVDDMILALGNIDESKKEALDKVIEEYNKLNFEQVAFVENKDVLLSAVETMQKLFIDEKQLTSPVTTNDVYLYPASVSVQNNSINGLDIIYNRGTYNDTVTMNSPVNLKDFHLTLQNLKTTNSTFNFCLMFSSTKNDKFDANASSYPLLLWFDFVAGTVKVYPHVGGTLVIKNDILKISSFGQSQLDIDITYLETGSYEMTVTTFEGSCKGLIPLANVGEVNKINNVEECYVQFTPWQGNAVVSFTVVNCGSESLTGKMYMVKEVKNIEVIKFNVNSFPQVITEAEALKVKMIKQMYDQMDDYIKSLVDEEIVNKLNDAYAQVIELENKKLTAPTLSINNLMLTIGEVEYAESYDLYVNGEYTTTTTELTFDLLTLGLKAGKYELLVKAYSEELDEGPSSEIVQFEIAEKTKPTEQKSGCKVAFATTIISSITAIAFAFVLLKKKQ